MTRRTDLHDVLDGLIVPSEKRASEVDLSTLSLFELEALMEPKTAGNGDPLREHMHRKGLLKKQAEEVEYTGQVNNGVPSAPEWPRAALGVDSAGRKASPEEKREQEKSVTPDVQHVQPHSDGEQFVSKGAHDEKLLGLFEKSATSAEWRAQLLGRGVMKRLGLAHDTETTKAMVEGYKRHMSGSARSARGSVRDFRHATKSPGQLKELMDAAHKKSPGEERVFGITDQLVKQLNHGSPASRADLMKERAAGRKAMEEHTARKDLSRRLSEFKAKKSTEKTSSLADVGAALRRPF